MDDTSRLVLGTVQFGLRYGVANRTGQPAPGQVLEIIKAAWVSGVREFDTAQDYGTSEDVLGTTLAGLGLSGQARVISKIDPQLDHLDAGAMAVALEGSLQRLRVPSLYGLMLHKEELLQQWDQGIGAILKGFVRAGKVRHLGVSVYSPAQALKALDIEGLDLVQVPTNILDRRFERCRVFEMARERGKQVYVRSMFLQGLVLMDPQELPAAMGFARSVLENVSALSLELGLSRYELAVGYLKAAAPQAKLLMGVDTVEQVVQNIRAWQKDLPPGLVARVRESFPDVSEKVLNPSLWSVAA